MTPAKNPRASEDAQRAARLRFEKAPLALVLVQGASSGLIRETGSSPWEVRTCKGCFEVDMIYAMIPGIEPLALDLCDLLV